MQKNLVQRRRKLWAMARDKSSPNEAAIAYERLRREAQTAAIAKTGTPLPVDSIVVPLHPDVSARLPTGSIFAFGSNTPYRPARLSE